MNKAEYIKSLSKVKVIIGNGFDLHCGLHTTYSDYYCKNYKKYLFIQNLYSKYEETNELNLDFQDSKINLLNVWDVFFALNSSKNPKECKQQWCDIEKLMLSSLMPYEEPNKDTKTLALGLFSKIHWRLIAKYVSFNQLATNHTDRFVVKFVKEKMDYKKIHYGDFYKFLLSELKEFEHSFGEFIYWQLHISYYERINYGRIFLNVAYIEMAIDTLDELCNKDNLVGIDSFNYSYIHTEKMSNVIQHINGNYENPIFGIDTVFEPSDVCFPFTKTGRRIDSDMFDESFDSKPDFDNVIIFGHSLDESDYSYFFPVFDKLNLTDSVAKNVVVFAYSVFNIDKEEAIKANLRQAISNIMLAYAKSKNLTDPKRFLDSLSTQKRIITYEVPVLNRRDYEYSLIDQDWDKLYKEIDALNL